MELSWSLDTECTIRPAPPLAPPDVALLTPRGLLLPLLTLAMLPALVAGTAGAPAACCC